MAREAPHMRAAETLPLVTMTAGEGAERTGPVREGQYLDVGGALALPVRCTWPHACVHACVPFHLVARPGPPTLSSPCLPPRADAHHMVMRAESDGQRGGDYDRVRVEHGDLVRKAYLGGYRSKRTGLEYHHASTQTPGQRRRSWEDKAPK